MEEQKSIAFLVIIGTIIIISLISLFVVFIIAQKRKQHSLKVIIEMLKAKETQDLDNVRSELEIMKREIEELKKNKADKPNS